MNFEVVVVSVIVGVFESRDSKIAQKSSVLILDIFLHCFSRRTQMDNSVTLVSLLHSTTMWTMPRAVWIVSVWGSVTDVTVLLLLWP